MKFDIFKIFRKEKKKEELNKLDNVKEEIIKEEIIKTKDKKETIKKKYICNYCKKKIREFTDKFHCKYCNKIYCPIHRIPETHKCKGKLINPYYRMKK